MVVDAMAMRRLFSGGVPQTCVGDNSPVLADKIENLHDDGSRAPSPAVPSEVWSPPLVPSWAGPAWGGTAASPNPSLMRHATLDLDEADITCVADDADPSETPIDADAAGGYQEVCASSDDADADARSTAPSTSSREEPNRPGSKASRSGCATPPGGGTRSSRASTADSAAALLAPGLVAESATPPGPATDVVVEEEELLVEPPSVCGLPVSLLRDPEAEPVKVPTASAFKPRLVEAWQPSGSPARPTPPASPPTQSPPGTPPKQVPHSPVPAATPPGTPTVPPLPLASASVSAQGSPQGPTPRPSRPGTPGLLPDAEAEPVRRARPQLPGRGQVSLCIQGDCLELVIAPGDILSVRGNGRLTEIGTTHGLMGHVMLVLTPPKSILRLSEDGWRLKAAWPGPDIDEVWMIRTLESTRAEQGLHEAEMLLYVTRNTGELVLIGEIEPGPPEETLCLIENETVEVWQSPVELRSQLRLDAMQKVLMDMKSVEANWSGVTAARAVMSNARVAKDGEPAKMLESLRSCWHREPICTSVVISFWQRYICEVAAGPVEPPPPGEELPPLKRGQLPGDALDYILQWMPLKADRGLPGALLGAMRGCGWIPVAQVPRIFRPCLLSGPGEAPQPSARRLTSVRQAPQPSASPRQASPRVGEEPAGFSASSTSFQDFAGLPQRHAAL